MIDIQKYYNKHKDDPIPTYIKKYDVSKTYGKKQFFTYIRKYKGELIFITVHKNLKHTYKILFRSPSNVKQGVFVNYYPIGMGGYRIERGSFYINKPRNFNRDELFIPECERYMAEKYPYFPLEILSIYKGYHILENYDSYPGIEQLMKLGVKDIDFIKSRLIGKKLTQDKNFRKFCGTKEALKMIKHTTPSMFLWFYKMGGMFDKNIKKILASERQYSASEKTYAKLLKSFANKNNYQWFCSYFKNHDVNIWEDYIDMTDKLNKYYLPKDKKLDSKEKRFVFPNNLEFWHDTRSEQLEHYIRLELLKQDLKERHEKRIESKRAKILFENLGNLKSTERIKVLTKEKEFEHEAKVMKNCIYSMGYFEKFEKANCLICDVDNHKAVFEFDLRTKTVRQLYGYHNADLEKDYRLDVVSHINLWRDQNQEILNKIN